MIETQMIQMTQIITDHNQCKSVQTRVIRVSIIVNFAPNEQNRCLTYPGLQAEFL